MIKTNKEHFEYFKKCCKYYIKKFNLDNWDIDIQHRELRNNFGESSINGKNYVGSIKLNKTWSNSKELNKDNLDLVAKHEVIHFLIGRYTWLSNERFLNEEELEASEEELVNKLTLLL